MAEPLASETVACGSRDSFAPDALQRGTRLGRYELLVPVAVGGMARVWAARLHGQRGFTKVVAIKTILPHLASDPEFERMLVDEARIASRVRHPNVCETFELGEEDRVLYLAMEWVDGDSLSNVLKAGGAPAALSERGAPPAVDPVDPRVAARIVADACAGLHAAHDLADDAGAPLDVVHRDVSPHNLLVSLGGNVKVTDFGVAKARSTCHPTTQTGQLKGKLAYMAPEQAKGAAVDRRSDVFSLGCVLYEATTGRQPFRGPGEHAVMQELLKGAFAPPSRVVRGYPYELERIVMRAMAQQPLHRFPTMDQMRLALEEWLAKSGPVVTQSHVAAVVRGRIATEAERRRERIQAAAEGALGVAPRRSPSEPGDREPRPDPPGLTPSGVQASGAAPSERRSSAPAASVSVPPPAPEESAASASARSSPSRADYAMASALGVMAAAALIGAAIAAWRAFQPAPASPPPTVAAAVALAPETPPPTSAPPPVAGPPAAPPVVFKVLPEHARLVVNGEPQGADVRSLPRPAKGEAVSVVVRAEGFREEALTISDDAPATVDVWLSPTAPASRRGATKSPGPLLPNPY